jgi:hypothetical protein
MVARRLHGIRWTSAPDKAADLVEDVTVYATSSQK